MLGILTHARGCVHPAKYSAEIHRDLARLAVLQTQIAEIAAAHLLERLKHASDSAHTMIRLLARVIGTGIETAEMLVTEVLSRNLRNRRAVARYAGLTGSPDESGSKRHEKGLAQNGKARGRHGKVQPARGFLLFFKEKGV